MDDGPNDDRARADADLDEALEETFPASDPTANTVETGIRNGELKRPAGDDRDRSAWNRESSSGVS